MTAEEYMTKRFPRATEVERVKIIRDWDNKIDTAKNIVADFSARTGQPVSGLSVLDAGAGNGGMSIGFAEAGAQMVGVDIEADLVDIARARALARGTTAEFVLYDGYQLPFADGMFDAALSVSVLEHVTNPANYLKEILRTVKPGGYLYLAFPNRLWPKETHTGLWFITYLSYSLADRVIKLFKKNPLADNNLHFYGYFSLISLLNKARISGYEWQIIEEKGDSHNLLKISIKNILRVFGLSYKMFLPHISVILKKKQSLI